MSINMRKYVFISIGGVLGAILRYWFKGVQITNYHENFPLNTFIINITGSFILALVLTSASEVWKFDSNIRIGIAVGFLGALTTFSTLCKETAGLLYSGDYFPAISYIAASTLAGLAAAYYGMILARKVVSKFVKKYKEEMEENEAEIIGRGME